MSQFLGRTGLAYSRLWHVVDLKSDPRTLGRVASEIANVLMGKHKPIYDPGADCGDYVVVKNCNWVKTSGNKMKTDLYYRHTTRPGSLVTRTMEELKAEKGGGELMRLAVKGMLPKNRLRKIRLDRLKTFEGEENPYEANATKIYDTRV
ncbi:hypothetical protein CANCADRAFT_27295 [Tortispora caseinolytica NRRL Y-17796]|uniref:Ribosomal protein L13 n=1 Tax=Tortispora caseinolytica NRRL Y-17796 TaxID=767744 RepID=A0A1E4TA12_9ASCO|nr:hypothetical protein CANCADRAFT_27295 [Tortispora caseinolytica NRRL Y-17796]